MHKGEKMSEVMDATVNYISYIVQTYNDFF